MKQFLSSVIAATLIVCCACIPFSGQIASPAPSVSASPAAETAAPTEYPVETVSTVSGVVVSAENGAAAIMPLPGEALLASADLVAFPSADLTGLDVKKGDIVQVFYTGSAAETYPVQIHATNWSILESTSPLHALLTELAASVFPGTAGSSLTAAAYAARLLDCQAEYAILPASASAVAAALRNSLDAKVAAQFSEQLALVLDASDAILKDTGRALLESSGYTPAYYPWEAESAGAFLAALSKTPASHG